MATIGELGEQIVAEWLQSQGYSIRHCRWRCRWGEIDIIAVNESSNILVFVEVKTRSNSNWDEGGLKAISLAKQQKIYQTAQYFLGKHPHLAEYYCRFDVALVSYQKEQSEVKLIIKDYLENAFEI
ncbi:MAG: YraN family protein [Xenococcaceae cyanobacterium MO_167.B27]|nr:YraN family protein [Xenococcaceae cyanobacterium MO_167.B27]